MGDDQPLKYIFSPRSKLNARISRWKMKLQGYYFNDVYKKRSTNIADYLFLKCKVDDDNGIADNFLYINYLSKMKVSETVSLEKVTNECKEDQNLFPYEMLS